jgi:pimeloyl-ACP methyl ester carboxylesterase
MVEAFFFGSGPHKLFATYHPAREVGGDVLTIICPPLFSEGMRTQFALREVAIALAESGQHVLRFDYRGTGDSSGTLAEMRVSDWLEDIQAVIREGLDVTGANRVNFVGVRAGALFLCRALREQQLADKVVLWDPISNGADYIGQLRRIQSRMVDRNNYLSRRSRKLASEELGGHRITEALRKDIEHLDASVYKDVPARVVTVIETHENSSVEMDRARRQRIGFRCNWETDSEDLLVPQPVLEGIRQCLLAR